MIPLPIPEVPFGLVGIDKFGSIQNSSKGYKYVLIAVDFCTRWVIAHAVKDATADTAAKFVTRLILTYSPKTILCDNGSEFKGAFEETVRRFDVELLHSSPRHPRCNGMVERANQSISQIMRTIIMEQDHSDWSEALLEAVQCYNTSVHEVTGYTPHFLLYGHESNTNKALGEQVADNTIIQSKNLQDCRREACERTAKYRSQVKNRFDKTRNADKLRVDDEVMVEIETSVPGISRRFAQRRKGPFRVIQVHDNNNVTVKGMGTETTRVHVERCIKILPRPTELQIDTGIDTVIDEVVRGPDSATKGDVGGSTSYSESVNTDDTDSGNDLNNLVPLRKSLRIRRRPQRLIETMKVAVTQDKSGNQKRSVTLVSIGNDSVNCSVKRHKM